MTDAFEELKARLREATPKPDTKLMAQNLQRAEENFERTQASRSEARLTARPARTAAILQGAKKMLSNVMTRGVLATTSALAAVAFVWVLQDDHMLRPSLPDTLMDTDARAVVPTASVSERAREQANQDTVTAEVMSEPTLALDAPQTAVANDGTTGVLQLDSERRFDGLNRPEYPIARPDNGGEAFANEAPNRVQVTATNPVATLSADVDTASWSILRSSLGMGMLPPPDSVRVEEMINYFPYGYPAPQGQHPLLQTVTLVETPWNADTQLLHIGVQGALPSIEERPSLNLVFLVDTSGSMQYPAKLPLLKQSFRLMLSELRPEDSVAIIAYAGSAGQVLEPTPATDRAKIIAALDQLESGGSTAGQEGLELAYSTAAEMAEDGEVSRVILATDGDFNVGLANPDDLANFVSTKRDEGIYLSVLGFGRGNLDDATMQALAQNGNGQAAYIDTLSEARKVLVDQLTGALFPIANDLKLQVEFNPAVIAEYRVIGYETRTLAREDFNNDQVDAGDIGAGHTVTALIEVTPVGSPAVLNSPLRYSSSEIAEADTNELGFLKLRYKRPGEDESILIEAPISPIVVPANDDIRFASAIAGFGQMLRGSDYLGNWGFGDAIELANRSRGEDVFGYRTEAVSLMRLAEALSR